MKFQGSTDFSPEIMPVPQGSHGGGVTCFDRMKMGFMMGMVVGMCSGENLLASWFLSKSLILQGQFLEDSELYGWA